jgi:hypothetical protein
MIAGIASLKKWESGSGGPPQVFGRLNKYGKKMWI